MVKQWDVQRGCVICLHKLNTWRDSTLSNPTQPWSYPTRIGLETSRGPFQPINSMQVAALLDDLL